MSHHHFITTLAIVVSVTFMSGCATEAYLSERKSCNVEATQKYPPVYESRLVNRARQIDVPSGVETCTTTQIDRSKSQTRCVKEMRKETVNDVEEVDVDVNLEARNRFNDQCATQSCLAKFGNAECKAPKNR